jgi:hypothetical protein
VRDKISALYCGKVNPQKGMGKAAEPRDPSSERILREKRCPLQIQPFILLKKTIAIEFVTGGPFLFFMMDETPPIPWPQRGHFFLPDLLGVPINQQINGDFRSHGEMLFEIVLETLSC